MPAPKVLMAMALAALTCQIMAVPSVLASQQQPVAGDILSAIKLETPGDASHIRYLGLTGSGQFTLPQVNADIVVVEILNIYCPFCQGAAPSVNRLHQLVETDPGLKDKVKLLGVGIGNTPYEVDLFRGKFQVTFPLVADPDAEVQKSSEQRFRTPTFIVLRKTGKSELQVSTVHVGTIDDVDEFLRSITGR